MLNEYLWKEHEVVCLLLAPSCFYPSLPERQHSKAIANAGCVDEDASVQRLVETGRENADVTRAEQASSDGGVGAGWEAGDAPRVWSSGGTEVTGTRRCPRGGKELFRVLRLLDHIYLPALKKCIIIIIVFWPCGMACGILGTEAVSPVVDCQISPPVASLFKNIYLIF